MPLDRATVSRIRSAQERYESEKAKGVITKLELEVMASRLGQLIGSAYGWWMSK